MTLDEIEKVINEFNDSKENWAAQHVMDKTKVRELLAVAKAARREKTALTQCGFLEITRALAEVGMK